MSEKLKPCPFCGWKTVLTLGEFGAAWCQCPECGCDGPTEDSEANAIDAWNRRELESASQPGGGEAVAKIVGVDEYGPQLQWS